MADPDKPATDNTPVTKAQLYAFALQVRIIQLQNQVALSQVAANDYQQLQKTLTEITKTGDRFDKWMDGVFGTHGG